METGGLCGSPLPKVSEALCAQDSLVINLEPFPKTQEINKILNLATSFSQWLHINTASETFESPNAQTNEISLWVGAKVLVMF